MKNFIALSITLLFATQIVFAQHDNLINSSAEWIRTPARNAAIDAGDIVVYNPAGLVRMSDGFHINIGNQSLFRKPTHSYDLGLGEGTKTFAQDGSDPFLPNLYASYKKDKWALFTGIFVAGGGATANYPTGSITTDLIGLQVLTAAGGAYGMASSQYLKASSMYLTSTFGMAYAVNSRVSFAVAGRYIDAKNTTKGGMTFTMSPIGLPDAPYSLETEEKASNYGGVMSMMVKASPRFDFTVRYETAVKLDFETKQKKDDFGATVDGEKNRRDLPGVFAVGTAYAASSSVKIYGDFNYYFQQNADWGKSSKATNEKGYSTMAGDAATYALAATFSLSDKFLFSTGVGYTDFMYENMDGYFTKVGAYETAPNDNYNINAGFSIKATSNIVLTAGYMHTIYQSSETNLLLAQPLEVKVKSENKLDAIAIGLDLTF